MHQHIPDYSIEMDDGEMIVLRNRGTAGIVPAKFDDAKIGYLNAMTFEAAKEVCPGWEIYYLEREWLEWMTEEPRNRDARSSASAANGSSDGARRNRNHTTPRSQETIG